MRDKAASEQCTSVWGKVAPFTHNLPAPPAVLGEGQRVKETWGETPAPPPTWTHCCQQSAGLCRGRCGSAPRGQWLVLLRDTQPPKPPQSPNSVSP